jgi:hypothetical protein
MALHKAVTGGLAAQIFGSGPVPKLALVRAAWARVVGAGLAHRTEVLAIEGNTLRLRVPDARWRKVLHRMQGDLLRRLRELIGNLAPRRLGFTEGPVMPAPPEHPALPAPREAVPAPQAVIDAAAAIADVELRARFLESAARYLSRSSD